MKIQKRKTNSKRHTIGYKVSGKWMTRSQVYKLALMGKIEDVVACRGKSGGYVQSRPRSERSLYSLDRVVE